MLAAPALAGLAPALRASGEDDPVIAAAADAIDVFDFERLAHAKLPPAHWGYLKTGVDGDATLLANDAGFANYSLRMRRLVDISRIDTSVTLFGRTWPSPTSLIRSAASARSTRTVSSQAQERPARRNYCRSSRRLH